MLDITQAAQNAAKIINEYRRNNISFKNVRHLGIQLNKDGILYGQYIATYLNKINRLERSKNGLTISDNNNPIHYGGLKSEMEKIRQYFSKNSVETKFITEKIESTVEQIEPTEEFMINSLKAKGYRILKPILQYEEL